LLENTYTKKTLNITIIRGDFLTLLFLTLSGRGIVKTVLRKGGKKWGNHKPRKGLCSSESVNDILSIPNISMKSYQHISPSPYRYPHMTWCHVDKLWVW
jgi:hypothetical protein